MQKRIDGLSSHSIELPQTGKLLLQCWTRLRHTPLSLFVFQLSGLAIFLLWTLIGYYGYNILKQDIEPWLHFKFYANIPTPFVMTVAFGLGADKIGDLAEKPARFLAILVAGAAISATLINLVFLTVIQGLSLQQLLLHIAHSDLIVTDLGTQGIVHLSTDVTSRLSIWMWTMLNVMFVYGIVSWLFVLHACRVNDRARLESEQVRLSTVARRVAQMKLMTARAQVEPEMITRILRTLQALRRGDASRASALLDNLTAYLRLMMNRRRRGTSPLEAELAFITCYLKLYEAETGVHVDLRADAMINENIALPGTEGRSALSLPLFMVVKKIFDAADGPLTAHPVLHIVPRQGRLALELEVGATPLSEHDSARLLARLRDIAGGDLITLFHSFKFGVNRYVVHLADA